MRSVLRPTHGQTKSSHSCSDLALASSSSVEKETSSGDHRGRKVEDGSMLFLVSREVAKVKKEPKEK